MKPGLTLLVMAMFAASAAAQDFSRSLRPEEFAAAGLGKLSPAELARLDALVRNYRPVAPAARNAPAPRAEAAGNPAVLRVAPGTTIEYTEVESRLVGRFNGWEPRMVFTLENGQRWQVLDTAPYYNPPLTSPAVTIKPGALGSFWMTIEGAARPVKVRRLPAAP